MGNSGYVRNGTLNRHCSLLVRLLKASDKRYASSFASKIPPPEVIIRVPQSKPYLHPIIVDHTLITLYSYTTTFSLNYSR